MIFKKIGNMENVEVICHYSHKIWNVDFARRGFGPIWMVYMMVCITCVLQVHALKKFYGIMQNSAKMT